MTIRISPCNGFICSRNISGRQGTTRDKNLHSQKIMELQCVCKAESALLHWEPSATLTIWNSVMPPSYYKFHFSPPKIKHVLRILKLSSISIRALVGSWLFWIQDFPCSVCFWCMFGVGVEIWTKFLNHFIEGQIHFDMLWGARMSLAPKTTNCQPKLWLK